MINNNKAQPQVHLWSFSASAAGWILFVTFAIAITLFVVHQQRLSYQTARAQLVVDAIFRQYPGEPALSFPALKHRAEQLLQLDGYQALTVVDIDQTVHLQYGLPLYDNALNQSFRLEKSWTADGLLYIPKKIQIAATPALEKPFWLIIRFDKTYATLLNLQFIFVVSLILFATIGFSLFFHRNLQKDIFQPLQTLSEFISQQNRNNSLAPLTIANSGIYYRFLQDLNELISIQIAHQMDYRAGIEKATQELRESLETVEIHNIDLDLARKNAVELNNLKSEFLKKTSLDLRTPLSGILGFSELLRKTSLNRDQLDYIATIEESTKGILTIVADIHDFSRLENGNLLVDQKPMEPRRIIEDTLMLQAPIANERDVSLYSSVDSDIPNFVLGDPIRLQQVISNLASNAVKFEQSSFVEVFASSDGPQDSYIDINISINTDGICPTEFDNWKPVSAGSSETHHQFYSGAGIGLSIAKGIAHHMGGEINFSATQTNSTFSLNLRFELDATDRSTTKAIDPSYKIHALVYANSDRSYREVTSRLTELGITNKRANNFSDILSIANELREDAQIQSRFMPLAVIDAQTSQQTLDKVVFTQSLNTLVNDYNIPAIVISPKSKAESLHKILRDVNVHITHHPLITPRFRKGILDQLGILKLTTQNTYAINHNHSATSNILVVDDNKANLKLAKALLSDFHVKIFTAETGMQALSVFKENKLDLVFMDVQLPDMNGLEVTKEMRKLEIDTERTPIVALTAHNVADEKHRLLLAGMDDFVGKPITPKHINTIFDRWVADTKVTSKKPAPQQNDTPITNPPTTDQPLPPVESSPVSISDSLALAKDDASLAKDMLEMLIESLPGERSLILSYLSDGDYNGLNDTVHRLHGVCCYCGVPKLKNESKNTEILLRNGETKNVQSDIDKLINAIDEILTWHEHHDLDALFG